jgi:predicted alpha/beta hydrolase
MAAPLVLIAAAMAVPSGFYRPLVAAFEERGWEATALPTRGFERGDPIASRSHDWSYADEISEIADAVAKDAPRRPSGRSSCSATAWARSSAPGTSCTIHRPTRS